MLLVEKSFPMLSMLEFDDGQIITKSWSMSSFAFAFDLKQNSVYMNPCHYWKGWFSRNWSLHHGCLVKDYSSSIHCSQNQTQWASDVAHWERVLLDYRGVGNVWICCVSYLCVHTYFYLDREVRRAPGDTVHKIDPTAYNKVLDIRQCLFQMQEQAAIFQAAMAARTAAVHWSIAGSLAVEVGLSAAAGISVYDLCCFCLLQQLCQRMGAWLFQKEHQINPCWVEIQLNCPFPHIDEVIQQINYIFFQINLKLFFFFFVSFHIIPFLPLLLLSPTTNLVLWGALL